MVSRKIAPFLFSALLLAGLYVGFFDGPFGFFAGTKLNRDIWFLLAGFVFVGSFQFTSKFLFLGQATLAAAFLTYCGGDLLFSDDHPSFLYRLVLLKEHFPNIPFYNTDWNAGYSAREFFPSGVLNVFFVTAPFLYMLDLLTDLSWYNYLIAYIYIGLVPLCTYFACQILRLNRAQASLAAFMVMVPNFEYFRWLLQYGTLGFLFSVGLLPLTWSLAYRLGVDDETPPVWMVPLLLLSSALTLFWSLSFIPLLPLTLLAFFRPKVLFSRWKLLLCFVLCFVFVNYSWIYTFVTESKVGNFVKDGGHVRKIDGTGLSNFFGNLTEFNPLILVGGLFFSRERKFLALFGSAVFCLIVASWGQALKPQLELDRMVLPASIFLAIIAGSNFAGWLSFRIPRALICSLLVGGLLLGGAFYQNKTSVKFKLASSEFTDLISLINTSESDGRLFFSGFILHELEALNYKSQDGGHIAPLPLFTGRQMYASHFYHAKWTTVDPIPESYRKRGEEGIEEFFEMLNVSTVVSFSRPWASYYQSSDRYTPLGKVGRFRVFERKRDSVSWVSEGDAEVSLIKRGLKVKLLSSEVVLKYKFQPNLRSSSSVVIDKQEGFVDDLGEELDFIKLSADKYPQTVELRY